MTKASNDLLDAIHGLLAEKMRESLEDGSATSREWAVIVKFLKDNNIDALINSNEAEESAFAELVARAQESIERVQ